MRCLPRSRPLRSLAFAGALLSGLALAATPAAQPFAWAPAAPSPVERFEGVAAAAGERLYVFGGFADGLVAQTRADAYDPDADAWTRLADLPEPVTHAGVAVAGGRVVIAGGFVGDHPGVATDAVWIYDPAADAFAAGPPLPAPRASGALVHHLGRLHAVGGLLPDRRTDATDHWVLDLADPGAGWASAAPLPEGKNHFEGVSLGGRIYAVGGQTGHDGPNEDIAWLDIYDPEADVWTRGADLPEVRSHAKAGTFVWQGQIVVAGGASGADDTLASLRTYRPELDVWLALGTLPLPRRAPAVQVVGDWLVATTGSSGFGIEAEADTFVAPAGGAPRVLFLRGADRSGGFLEASSDAARTEQLADIYNTSTASGNHGWAALREALEQDGFVVEQLVEGAETETGPADGIALDLAALDLSAYDVIVFGSNNAVYSQASVDVVEAYVRGGGAALFISDANFGSDWADAPDSDQPFLDRFGLVMNQDAGTYALTRADGDFVVPDHPVLDGVDAFDGEGVSPVVLGPPVPGVAPTLLARAEGSTRVNVPPFGPNRQGASRPVQPGDAALVVAEVDAGRLAGHFDRNTFFNPGGAGTDLTRLDNRRYALNLFRWLARYDPGMGAVVPEAGDTIWLRALNDRFVAAESADVPLIASADALGLVTAFTLVDAGGGAVCLRSEQTGGFVAAEAAGAEPLIADRDGCGAWERFEFVPGAGETIVGVRARVNARFVAAESGGAAPLRASAAALGDESQFAWGLADVTAAEPGAGESGLVLDPVAPTPAQTDATVRYHLARSASVRVEVFDALGRRVAELAQGARAAGSHDAHLDVRELAGGLYVVRVTTPAASASVPVVVRR